MTQPMVTSAAAVPADLVTNGAEPMPVALVAGATRGAGRAIAVELARAGFFVYATGRSSRATGPSELGRPETIEETGELIRAAGGAGAARVVDHEDPGQVADLVAAIGDERGHLDVLVNDIFGGDRYSQWDKPLWEHDLQGGLRMLHMGVYTHLITCRAAIPVMLRTAASHGTRGLVVEMTDGTSQANAEFRRNVGFYYDLVKASVGRIVTGLAAELENLAVTPVGVTPGWLRSENMLENFGVTEASWRDACVKTPGFAISESPAYVARGVAALATAGDAARWAGTIVSSRQLADAYGVTDTDGSKPDCWATWRPMAGNGRTARILTGSADSGTANDPQRTGVSTVAHKPGRDLGDPKELLLGFLDYYRLVIIGKVDGLTDAQLRASRLPSGWTPLELVKHLAYMERRWLRWGFRAEQLPDPHGDEDPAGHWHAGPGDTAASLIGALRAAGEQTRAIACAAELTDTSAPGGRFSDSDPRPLPTLAWILIYVLQEYARHAGHLDVARELIDGATGE